METQSPRALLRGQESLTVHGALQVPGLRRQVRLRPEVSVPRSWTLRLKAVRLLSDVRRRAGLNDEATKRPAHGRALNRRRVSLKLEDAHR